MTDQKDIQLLEKLSDMKSRFFEEIGKSVIGQHDVLNHILIALPVSYTHLTLPTKVTV